jgi:hypothetical protein
VGARRGPSRLGVGRLLGRGRATGRDDLVGSGWIAHAVTHRHRLQPGAGEDAGQLPAGKDGAGGYLGFLGDEDEATIRAAYPGATRDRLRELKRRYDPDNLFHLNHNIPPADG